MSIRNSASKYGTQFKVITGGHDTLSLNDVNGIPKNIFLSSSKLPVPKFTWKVVKNLESLNAIAFVTINNPFVQNVLPNDVFCSNICEQNGWNNIAFNNTLKGYTYCCDVNTLRNSIPTIPSLVYYNVLKA